MTRHATMLNRADIDARGRLLHKLQKELNASARRGARPATPASVHDLRAATRRLRILLRALRHETDPALYGSIRFELHNLADVTGPAREAYVRKQIVALRWESGPDHATQGAKACLSVLHAESERATDILREIMEGREWSSSLARINKALASPQLFGIAGGNLRGSLSVSFEGLLQTIDRALRHKVNADKCHWLRIKARNAYYLGEMSHSLSGKPGLPVILRLKKMQSALGDLHDAMQFGAWLKDAQLTRSAESYLSPKIKKLRTEHLDRCRKQRKSLRRAAKEYFLARGT